MSKFEKLVVRLNMANVLKVMLMPLAIGKLPFTFAAAGPLIVILMRYAWSIPIVAILGFAGSLLEGLGIGLLIPLLSTLLDSGRLVSGNALLAPLMALVDSVAPGERLVSISAVIVCLLVLKGVVQAVNSTFIAWVDGRVGNEIRLALSRQILNVGYPFFLTQDSARLITIISTETWRASDAIRMISNIVAASAAIVVFCILLLLVDWKLFTVILAGLGVVRGIQALFTRRLGVMSEMTTVANRSLEERMLVIVEAMRIIRVFGRQDIEQRSFELASERVRRSLFRVERALAMMAPMVEVLHAVLFLLVLIIANGIGMNVPTIMTFLVLLYRMQPHLNLLNQSRLGLGVTRGPVSEVEWLLDTQDKPKAPTGFHEIVGLSGPIAFEHVNFSYDGSRNAEGALHDISFSIPSSGAIALLGHSGSGKSTIVNLICRLLEPSTGRITVGGIDLGAIDPTSWLQQIGLAGQDVDLVEGTIADNITYGSPGVSAAEVRDAARLADADGFISVLSQGYDTHVGSRGINLSGGQRQRIGVARALIRKADVLILDEATSSADGLTEGAIVSLLKDRSRYKVAIVISHRLSTIACCENGIVLAGGKVVESGKLEGLSFYRMMKQVASASGQDRV
jgi:ATP-binding cassette, subfamily B, bacterial MsbA